MIRGMLCAFALAAHAAFGAPNLVVMIADDMAWNDAGIYGHPHIRTPNIDKLAGQGMRFDNAFLTTSSCSPSRCSIITGKYPHATGAGALHDPLPASQTTVAQLLHEGGYYTAAAGKWHMGDAAKTGFDKIYGGGPSGCEEWVKALRERPKDQPGFFWLASFDPHRPYKKDTIPEPHTVADAVVPPFLPDTAATRNDLAAYYDEITRLDEFVGAVLEELDAQGIADDTLVIFLSDNGRPFPRCKTTLYDSGIKTPLLARYPGHAAAGTTTSALVSAVDITPTLLAAAGIPAPESMSGHSFLPLLSEPGGTIRDAVYAEHNWHDYQARQRSVRTQQYLYIRDDYPELTLSPPADAVRSETYEAMIAAHDAGTLAPEHAACFVAPRPAEELYDVDADPYSMHNLAADPAHAETLAALRARLDAWQQETEDTPPDSPRPDGFDRRTGEKLKE
ncbi:MAG: sulfatase-like hydrolase/transferase [Candidatus Hydrogenedens sp.]|nr:sulfatase-like hydrolase/transferase [Candidatus Hydrogenedens sp.]